MPTWSVFKREDVRRLCEEQLERTGVEYFDNYLSGMSTMEQVEDNVSYMEDFKPLTMYESYVTRAGKPADLLKAEKDPVVIDGLRRAISSFENKNT